MKPTSDAFGKSKSGIDAGTIKVMILCVVGATIFWFFNALNKPYSATIFHPIQFDYDQDLFIATVPPPDEIRVNVRGVGWNILRQGYLFDAQPIRLSLENPDRSDRIAGSSLFGSVSEGLQDLDLNYILSDTLYLNIERKVSRLVFLDVDSLGIELAADHYIRGPILTEIDSVTLTGPESFISSYPDTVMLFVNGRRIDRDFDAEVEIDVGNDLVTFSKDAIRVLFRVERYIPVAMEIPVSMYNFPADSTMGLRDSTIKLTFMVGENRRDSIKSEDFLIAVDFEKMVTFDSSIQPLILQYPTEIKGLRMESRRARVTKLLTMPLSEN